MEDTVDLIQAFDQNSFEDDKADLHGGSIYSFSCTNITASENAFTNCSADEDGGAWYLDESSAMIEDVVMQGCMSKSDGGGITAISGSRVHLESPSFSFCKSDTGGAVSIRSSSILIVDGGSFEYNSGVDGGAVAIQEESEVVLSGGVSFSHNQAEDDGGAVFLVRLSPSDPFINGAFFLDNAAGVLGGSVYLALCDGMAIEGMVVWTSEAEAGSDIASLASELTITSSFFNNGYTGQGGIYLLHSDFEMTHTYLGHSEAQENGGLMYAFASDIIVGHCLMTNGTSGSSGAGIFLFDSPAHFVHTNFTDNTAGGSGGGLYITGTELVTVHNSVFTNNYAGTTGGAVHFQESTEFITKDCTYDSNSALLEGAGILTEDSSYVTVTNSTFLDNTVIGSSTGDVYGGGGLKLYMITDALVADCDFIGNGGTKSNSTNYHDGGAIYVAYSGTQILRCYFEGNTAANGGAVYFGPEPVEITRRLQKYSKAHLSPGFHHLGFRERLLNRPRKVLPEASVGADRAAVHRGLSTSSNVVIASSVFTNNVADSGGGALSYEDVEPQGLGNNSYTNNTALYGGAFTSPPAYIVAFQGPGYQNDESGYVVSPIFVEIRDLYHQVVFGQMDGDVFCESADEDATVSSQTSATFHKGVAVFDELVVEKLPNSSANISFQTSLVPGTTTIELHFKPCEIGEVLPENTGTCIYCGYGTFSVDATDTYCHECPTGAVCYGGSSIQPLSMYWRFPNSTGVCESNVHDDCRLHLCYEESACLGDFLLTESVQFNPADLTQLIVPYGTNTYQILSDNCWTPGRQFADCELALNGYFISITEVEESDTVSITLTEESFHKVQALTVDRTASYALHLRQKEQCAIGYIGNLCARCDKNYGRGSGYECNACPESMALSYFWMFLGIFVVVLLGAIMIKLQIKKSQRGNEKTSIMLKIFTSYLQLVSLFSALDMEWPAIIMQMFDKQEMLSKAGDRLISIDCIFNAVKEDYYEDQGTSMIATDEEDEVSIFYKKLAFFMCVPPGIVMFSGLFWYSMYLMKAIKFKFKKWNYQNAGLEDILEDGLIDAHEVQRILASVKEGCDQMRVNYVTEILDLHHSPARVEQFQQAYLHCYKKIVWENWILSVVVLMFMTHPNISQWTFLVFTCEELETGRWFLQEDLDTECGTPIHFMWEMACGLPFMLLYTIGIPGTALYLLNKNKQNLQNSHVKLKFGFLFDGYERRYFFWELWVMMRKICVIFVTVFLTPYGPMTEALAGLSIGVFALVLHLCSDPYIDNDLNHLESGSLYATIITLICGLFFYSHELDEAIGALMLFIVVIFMANALFVTSFVVMALAEYRKKLVDGIDKAQKAIIKKKKEMSDRIGKTKEERAFSVRKRKKVEVLDDLYERRTELEHCRLMLEVEAEAAKRKIMKERNELDHQLDALNKRLSMELRKESARHLHPRAQKKGSIVWQNMPILERALESKESIVEEAASAVEIHNAILSLYHQTQTSEANASIGTNQVFPEGEAIPGGGKHEAHKVSPAPKKKAGEKKQPVAEKCILLPEDKKQLIPEEATPVYECKGGEKELLSVGIAEASNPLHDNR